MEKILLAEGKVGKTEIKLYGEEKIHQYADDLLSKFEFKTKYISDILSCYLWDGVEVYLFLDENEYNQYVSEHYKESDQEPYKKATFDEESIVILCDEEKLKNKPFHYANVFAHILVHMIFQYKPTFRDNRVLWYEEGLAQLLSGEKNLLEDEEEFKDFMLRKVFSEEWKIPSIEYLCEHGNEFGKFDSDDYNSYSISYMLGRYLRDHNARFYNHFLENVYSIVPYYYYQKNDKDILARAYRFYGVLLGVPGYDFPFDSIRTPEDLFDYMELYITHGWIDINGKSHEHSLEGIRDIYRINSLEQILKSGLGTCIEQTLLEHFVLDNLGIENKILVDYSPESNSSDNVKLHVFCAYKLKNYSGYYYFEHANKKRKGIHVYWDFNSLCEEYLRDRNTTRILTEIPDIPVGYSLNEFIEYVNSFKNIGEGEKRPRR